MTIKQGDFRPRYLDRVNEREGWRYRRIIPEDLRPLFPKIAGRKIKGKPMPERERTEWTVSFGPKMEYDAICREVARLRAEHDEMIKRAKAGEILDQAKIDEIESAVRQVTVDGRRHEAMAFWAEVLALGQQRGTKLPIADGIMSALEHGGTYQGAVMTLAVARAKRGLGDRNEKPVNYAMSSFAPFGGSKDIREITRADVESWIRDCRKKGQAPSTIRRRIQALHAIVAYGFLEKNCGQANWFKVKTHARLLRNAKAAVTARQPFNHDMLAAIDSYIAKSKRLRETGLIMRLMRGTGGIPSEIGGAVLADLEIDSDVPSIWIRANNQRTLKVRENEDGDTPARDRIVPLIGDALVAAKDAYDKAKRQMARGANADDTPLFRMYKADSDRQTDSISQACNRTIRRAGVAKSERLTSYCFRHTVKQALKDSGATVDMQHAIMGHEGDSVPNNYGATYAGRRMMYDALDKALNGIDDKGVRIIGNIDPRNYTAAELVIKAPKNKKLARVIAEAAE